MSHRPLIILSPPRSFSSVVSTMIGQHPELYCFPELHIFGADTVGQVLDKEQARGRNYAGPPGALRALAQLHEGVQTTTTVLRAGVWLLGQRHLSTKELMDHLLESVAPRLGIEKSPATCMKASFLHRVYSYYPDAYFLHLTRNPVATRKSMSEFFQRRKEVRSRKGSRSFEMDHLFIWYRMHRNIIEFAANLQLGQYMRIKGEDVLSAPDVYLPQVAEWLGVSTEAAAIEEMKHPERSPYACVGPAPTRGGNDPKFQRSPALRSGNVAEPPLSEFLSQGDFSWMAETGRKALAEVGLDLLPESQLIDEMTGMAHQMGYR